MMVMQQPNWLGLAMIAFETEQETLLGLLVSSKLNIVRIIPSLHWSNIFVNYSICATK